MLSRRQIGLALGSMVGAGAMRGVARADDYPSQIIKVVIPNPPAGPGDVIARVFTHRAADILGKNFVFDYKPGASTVIGAQFVANAPPDGYTILGFLSAGLAISVLRKNMPYNLATAFKPILGLGSVPLALLVRSGLNFKNFEEFTAAVRSGRLFYGSAGVGTIAHLSGALLVNELKGQATHVAFRGNPDIVQAIMAGNLDFSLVSVADAAVVLGSPQVQVLAVTSPMRQAGMKDVPTMVELGHPGFNPRLWYAFLAPAKTPDDRVERLFKVFKEASADPGLQAQLNSLGFQVDIMEPEALNRMMNDEAIRWKQVIEANDISVND